MIGWKDFKILKKAFFGWQNQSRILNFLNNAGKANKGQNGE